MLPTFVIGLREGLEAALIVGIVAAFLKQRGRHDLLRLVWIGVAAAGLICLAVGIGLHVLAADLPQRQQEGLETVIGAIAIAMVTYMVVWMRRHSRDLKKQLEGAAGSALESGSGWALVAMAFLAVFREGFETAVFLVAAFNSSSNPGQAGVGVVLGLLLALVLGYGIYRGGVRINLSKFFRATGFVLVLVAAGLVVSALHTAHEAGWLNVGQQRTVDLTWLVQPGSVQSSLLTGMLGLQPQPVTIELIGWLLYLVPLGLYVAWPPGRAVAHRAIAAVAGGVAAVAVVAGVVLTITAPSTPAAPSNASLAVRTTGQLLGAAQTPATGTATVFVFGAPNAAGMVGTLDGTALSGRLTAAATTTVDGIAATRWTSGARKIATPAGLPTTLSLSQIAAINGGRLPLGVLPATDRGPIAMTYAATETVLPVTDRRTQRVLSVQRVVTVSAVAKLSIGSIAVGTAARITTDTRAASVSAQVATARSDVRDLDRRSLMTGWATAAWVLAVVSGLIAIGSFTLSRRRRTSAPARLVRGTSHAPAKIG